MITVTPAYGRDYKSAKAAREAWLAGDDFILRDITSQWDGKPCSVRDFDGQSVMVRYHKMTRVIIVPGKKS